MSGGREDCSPDYQIKRNSFPFWGIEFVTRGRGSVRFGEETMTIVAGSIFCYSPHEWHCIATDPSDPLVKYFVDFTGNRSADLLAESDIKPGSVIQTSAPGEILEILEELVRNGMAFTPFSDRIVAVILEHLLLKVAETSIPNESAGSTAFATYRKCRECIHDRWIEFKSLGEIADACHVAPAYLCRLFKKFDRQSPYQLLLRLKMNHAAVLLQSGTSLTDIADLLQFSDPFHFSRTFKKSMGISPSYFTRQIGQG